MHRELDRTDLLLVAAMRREPRASHSRLADIVGISRNTVHSRLDRLEFEGVITGYGPDIDPVKVGLAVTAFCLLEIAQGSLPHTEAELKQIPQVLDVHAVTGSADVLCRIVATTNDHLHEVLQRIAAIDTVAKSETLLSLSTGVTRTIADLLAGRSVER